MPVEFAVAAYRFGHSLIRPFYVLNRTTGSVDIFGPDWGSTSTAAGRSLPTWSSSGTTSFPRSDLSARPPRKIDTKLSIPLSDSPRLGRPAS